MKAAPASRILRWWPWAVIALVVALVVGLGGFDRRSDRNVVAAPGDELDSHDLVFTLSRATAQHVTSPYAEPYWELALLGTVRNPQDEDLAPVSGSYGHFALKDPGSGTVEVWTGGGLIVDGDPLRTTIPPGNLSMTLSVPVKFPDSYAPGPTILVAVAQMEYTDNVVLGLDGGERHWNIDSTAPPWLVTLPVTELPERRG